MDLTSEKRPKSNFIDLTTDYGEEPNKSATNKMGQPKANISELDNPSESKVNPSSKPRFAFKSSSAKSQPLIPKPGLTHKTKRDQPGANGLQREFKPDHTKPLIEPVKAQYEHQNGHPDPSLLPDDKKTQVPETPPKAAVLNPAISSNSKPLKNPASQNQELIGSKSRQESPSGYEVAQYDVESLEVSLEAYKNSLQNVLARVYNKHQTHVQVSSYRKHIISRFTG